MIDKVNLQNPIQTGTLSIPKTDLSVSFNPLLVTSAAFVFDRLPDVVFNMQSFHFPNIKVNSVEFVSRFVDTNEIGEKLDFEPYSFSFVVDSEMRNYSSVFNWMKRMTVNGSNTGETCDGTLIVNGQEQFKFTGCWPMELEGIDFSMTDTAGTIVTSSLTLNYDYINLINKYTTVDSSY